MGCVQSIGRTTCHFLFHDIAPAFDPRHYRDTNSATGDTRLLLTAPSCVDSEHDELHLERLLLCRSMVAYKSKNSGFSASRRSQTMVVTIVSIQVDRAVTVPALLRPNSSALSIKACTYHKYNDVMIKP